MRGKVFIIQEPLRKDYDTGEMVPMMDFRTVLEYGDPLVCLSTGRVSLSPVPMIDTLRDKLRNFSDADYIVSTGDPTAIFAAAMIASDNNAGRVKCLKWDKNSKRYIEVQLDIHYRQREARKEN